MSSPAVPRASTAARRRAHAARRAAVRAAKDTLPRPISSFVGREVELACALRLIGSSRLVTFTGPGGIGKTRLAIELAARSPGRVAAEATWVDLGAMPRGARVAPAIAIEIGLREPPGLALERSLVLALRGSSRLLVLDGCEHLLDECAPLVERLLVGCPRLRVLATSREPLGIPGEAVWPVPPLGLPAPPGAGARGHPARPARCDAVRLFVERASAADSRFQLTPQTTDAAVAICRRLEGLPLAIELVAARVRGLGVAAMAQRLLSAGDLLDARQRTGASRQQTLRATLEWSERLLDDAERDLWHRLAVFACGFHLATASAVCAEEAADHAALPMRIARLVEKSLVVPEGDGPGGQRYRLLEFVREYGRERLAANPAAYDALRRRHAEAFVALAESVAPGLRGADAAASVARLARDHDNLRTALTWALEPDGGAAAPAERARLGLRLGVALTRFWRHRGAHTEGRWWMQRLTARARETGACHAEDARLEEALAGATQLAGADGPGQGDAAPLSADATAVHLRVRSLGAVRVERAGRVLAAADGFYGKPRELLFYLLCAREANREQIGAALWPDASAAQLRQAFHGALHDLRRALGGRHWIAYANGRYAVAHRPSVWWDAGSLLDARHAARSAGGADGAGETLTARLEAAAALYGGPFLAGCDAGEWHRSHAEDFVRAHLEVLEAIATRQFAAGRDADAIAACRRALAADGFCERTHRLLMRALARASGPAQALQHYEHLRRLLATELDVAPSPETVALAESLRGERGVTQDERHAG